MQAGLLESYQPRRSPIHALPAQVKLLAALAVVLGVVGTPSRSPGPWLAGVALALAVAARASQVPPVFLLKRLLLLEPFVLGVAALSLWQARGTEIFCQAVTRSTLCLASLILLAATTPFIEIVRVLRRWHVPPLLLTTMTLMDRYLFVLVEESGRMQRARASRTFARPARLAVWHSLAETLGQLFVRSILRGERIYAAMCARGWDETSTGGASGQVHKPGNP